MKIAIISDTHGYKDYMDEINDTISSCDLIIHAGDNFSDSKYLHMISGVGVMAVKGNCDWDNVEHELVFEVENKTIYLTHGDRYRVKNGIKCIKERAKSVKADIVIFGHTHIPLHEVEENIIFINPGSLSLPRQVNHRSFVIMDIEENNIGIEFMNFAQDL